MEGLEYEWQWSGRKGIVLCDSVRWWCFFWTCPGDIASQSHPYTLNPIYLLNKLAETSLMGLFPNCCVALRIYCTLPFTVAQAERSFSVLKRIKNYLRSTMCQMRLTSLGTLAVESELAKQVNFDVIIESFANKKARKAAVGTAFELWMLPIIVYVLC